MKEMMKNAAILLAITIIAGGILGTVYEVTKAPIAETEAKAAMEAYKEVFSAADSFEEVLIPEDDATLADGGYAETTLNGLLEAKDAAGELLGYVFILTNHEGYGGDIQFTMGLTNDGVLNGISLLAIAETPGLGMKAEDVVVPQFVNKQATSFSVSKTGATNDSEIDAISGATITTDAIVNGVNSGVVYFQKVLKGGSANE